MRRGDAGYRAEPAGRPVCAGYLIWCISGCHTGHHAWNRKLSWWKLCGNHSFHWRDDHFFCGDRHCKHGWKGNFRKTDPCGKWRSAQSVLSFTNFVIYITNDKNAATEVMKWSMGSLAGASWTRVGVMLPVTLVCVAVFWTQYRNLNLMLLGDDVSITLGTDLHRLRTFYLIVASVMIGFAVYCAGVIGFVGLVIPHVVRILFGTDHRKLLPLSALLGASFLIWCDVACRVILKNSEMPIGVLVSIIGAPCFIYLLVRKSYGFGGAR